MSFHEFRPFSNWIFLLFYCCVHGGVLYIFQLVVVRYVVGMYFVPVCTLYFHLLYRVFGRAKVLKFVGVQFIRFSFLWPMFLVVRSKNCLPSPYVLKAFTFSSLRVYGFFVFLHLSS